jgi:hypothetical protein
MIMIVIQFVIGIQYLESQIHRLIYTMRCIGPVDPVEPVGYAVDPEVDPAAAEPIVAKPAS